MSNVLVTGSKGQLGNEIAVAASLYPEHNYYFTDIDELDITNKVSIEAFATANKIAYIINCAAYTAVDQAESNSDLCYLINETAVRNIGEIAHKLSIRVIHVSTDYVFDGKTYIPYTEENEVHPTSVYGLSKLKGEQALKEACQQSVIIRTSWLYSSFGNNFVKTMLRLGNERDKLGVIFDQVGTPTYATDLAHVILKIASTVDFAPGIYHYSNEGVCSWYDFTKTIFRLANIENCKVSPIQTKDYPTAALRPHYSVLNKTKIKNTYRIEIPYWEESLQKCLSILLKNRP